MTLIAAKDLARSFGAVQAVRSASITVEPGTVTGLVGPNGSGKTTLLLMLATLIAPDRGTLEIDDLDVARFAARVRVRIGWMPDSLGAWPALTVRETLEYTTQLYGHSRTVARNRASELIELLNLQSLEKSPAKVLSRGQKQRLGLARALVNDPKVLLLDEPAAGLDPEARISLRNLIRGFAAAGKGIVISSHVLSELEEIVDETVFMFDGATTLPEAIADTGAEPLLRTWRIRGAESTLDPRSLAELMGVDPRRLRQDRHWVLAQFANDSEAAHALTKLTRQGVMVSEFAPETGDLEHRFVQLHSRLQEPHPSGQKAGKQ